MKVIEQVVRIIKIVDDITDNEAAMMRTCVLDIDKADDIEVLDIAIGECSEGYGAVLREAR